MTDERTGLTDAAALAAGGVAAALSMLMGSGPNDLLGALVALTLALIIGAYVKDSHRDRWQSLAFASLMGVVTMPVGGFLAELCFYPAPLALITGWRTDPNSYVSNLWLLGSWLAIALATFCVDYRRQSRHTAAAITASPAAVLTVAGAFAPGLLLDRDGKRELVRWRQIEDISISTAPGSGGRMVPTMMIELAGDRIALCAEDWPVWSTLIDVLAAYLPSSTPKAVWAPALQEKPTGSWLIYSAEAKE